MTVFCLLIWPIQFKPVSSIFPYTRYLPIQGFVNFSASYTMKRQNYDTLQGITNYVYWDHIARIAVKCHLCQKSFYFFFNFTKCFKMVSHHVFMRQFPQNSSHLRSHLEICSAIYKMTNIIYYNKLGLIWAKLSIRLAT